ncbi:MAG: N-acetyl sugar amidotransferase [Alphaproteobacteria bacterium]|nr:N-acetyl sugar amidotransferase [Alphaproteobacteria bacterium]
MPLIPRPAPVDLAPYSPDAVDPPAFYGLPRTIRFCARCVYSNQKPNSEREYKHTRDTRKSTVGFDAQGLCDACRVALGKKAINWATREAELRALCDRFRRDDGHYDCLVPGSGGKDSFYAAHMLKYKFGMNPLTVTWAPHIYTDWGWKNFQAWIHAGFDNVLFTPNGRVHRLLTRLAVERIFHPFQPFMMGQMYFPPKMAIERDIPLVFYGENPAEYGNPVKENESARKDWSYFTSGDPDQIHIAGTSMRELKQEFGLKPVDLEPYLPPDPAKLEQKKVEVHYLGYYLPWHPQANYYYAVEHGDFVASPERTAGTYSKYSSIDDKIDDLHYYTTFIKFGIGRATYDAAQEARSGDITRDEAVALVKRFDGEYPQRFEAENFEYLSLPRSRFGALADRFEEPIVDRAYFEALTDRFRSPHLWQKEQQGWRLRRTAWMEN